MPRFRQILGIIFILTEIFLNLVIKLSLNAEDYFSLFIDFSIKCVKIYLTGTFCLAVRKIIIRKAIC